MSNHFKKKKQGNLKDRNNNASTILASRRLSSNTSMNFKYDMDEIEHNNDDLLGSLIGKAQEDRVAGELLKQEIEYQKEKKIEIQQQKEKKQEDKAINNAKLEVPATERVVQNQTKATDIAEQLDTNNAEVETNKNDETTKLLNTRPKILSEMEVLTTPDPPAKPKRVDENGKIIYGQSHELRLLIIALKKHIKAVETQNTQLKKKVLGHVVSEQEHKIKIKELAIQVEELELQKELMGQSPSKHINFDIQDLDARLKVMNDNLHKACGDDVQEKFAQQIILKNKNFSEKVLSNSTALKKLTDDFALMRTTLIGFTNK